jgi:hypothetical protein
MIHSERPMLPRGAQADGDGDRYRARDGVSGPMRFGEADLMADLMGRRAAAVVSFADPIETCPHPIRQLAESKT